MTDEFVDVRIKKTKQQIYHGLLSALVEKDFKKILVKDIVERAGISRATFYLHYQSKEELVNKYETETLKHLTTFLPIAFQGDRRKFFLQMTTFLSQEGKLFALLFSNHGTIEVQEGIKTYIRTFAKTQFVPKLLPPQIKTEVEKDYFMIYYSSAIFGVVQAWINRGQLESPSELADILDKIVPFEFFQ